jgi:hypothetical protein
MHHLRRVAAGLRGEYMEPDKTLELEDDQNAVTDVVGGQNPGKGRKKNVEADEDWQDMASYQAEQGIEIGEIAPRTNVVQEGGEEPEVRATGHGVSEGKKRKTDQEDEGGLADGKKDKEARKKAKKERDLQRKREKAKKSE